MLSFSCSETCRLSSLQLSWAPDKLAPQAG
jgi:hypothetical protein